MERPTLLVIDDVPLNLAVFEHLLERDFNVCVADSGEAGLALLESRTVDLILLDVMMPRQDGFSLCQRILADPRHAGIPLLFVSALGNLEAEARGIALGAVDFIQKPVSRDVLLARVRGHLERAQEQAGLRQQLARQEDGLAVLRRRLAGDARDTERHCTAVLRRVDGGLRTLLASVAGLASGHPPAPGGNDRDALLAGLAELQGALDCLSLPAVGPPGDNRSCGATEGRVGPAVLAGDLAAPRMQAAPSGARHD